MKPHPGPVYEVTLCIDRELGDELDVWLAEHVEEMLEVPGFVSADTCTLDVEGDQVARVTRYAIESDALLDSYLENEAPIRRQSAIDRFGDQLVTTRRVLRPADNDLPGLKEPPRCLNCDSLLNGQYCGQCGQRAASRLISIWELISDAFGDLFEFDSRLWRTLIPLAVRPGRLTRDYLLGRRARYMPPFRMYIVLSLVFFLVAFFNPRETLGILFPADTPETSRDIGAARVAAELRNELDDPENLFDEPDEEGLTLSINGEGVGGRCELEDYDSNTMPPWLARRFTKERVQDVCNRLIAEDGEGIKGFVDKLRDNAPIGLFVLLPLTALVLKILYPLSKRYYVEHLLFVVHYHAFIFLALTLQILFARSLAVLGLPDAFDEMAGIAISIYIPVYLYKSLRRVYGQGRWLTLFKMLLLSFGYACGSFLILIFAVIFAAFSV